MDDAAPTWRESQLRHFAFEISVSLPAPPPRVWAALTLDIDAWWNYRLRDRARSLIEPRIGGSWIQSWDNGGALFGVFTVWDPPNLMVLTGPLAMTRPAYNTLEFAFEGRDGETLATVRHAAFGDLAPDTGQIYANGWQELFGISLREHLLRR